MKIKIKYISNKIDKIQKIKQGDWYDLRSSIDIFLKKGEFKLIPLGVAMKLPDNFEGHIVPRGSTYKNFKIIQSNHCGIVDNSFCGDGDEWKMAAIAMEDTEIHINDRICQFRIIEKQPEIEFEEVDSLGNKDRGSWGSTGKN